MAPYPPKPIDRPAQPRHKRKKEEKSPPSPPQHRPPQLLNVAEITDEITSSDNRAAAIVGAGLLENNLTIAILCRFRELTDGQQKEICEKETSVLGTFFRKVQIGFALAIFDQIVNDDLDAIRRIRNTFAHHIEVRSFDHDKVKEDCDRLFGPEYLELMDRIPKAANRKERYIRTTAHLAARFDAESKILRRPEKPRFISYEFVPQPLPPSWPGKS